MADPNAILNKATAKQMTGKDRNSFVVPVPGNFYATDDCRAGYANGTFESRRVGNCQVQGSGTDLFSDSDADRLDTLDEFPD
jgi:hypothetical protein